jgi:uncharacterized C2H2 Zn-finger protein
MGVKLIDKKEVGLMTYICPICDQQLMSKQDFIRHVKNKHTRKEVKQAVKRLKR